MHFSSEKILPSKYHLTIDDVLHDGELGLVECENGQVYYRYASPDMSTSYLACISKCSANILVDASNWGDTKFREFSGKLILTQ